MTDAPETPRLTTIHIDPKAYPGPARGAVNGQRYEVPSGQNVGVTDAVLEALTNSHIPFTGPVTVQVSTASVEGAAGVGSSPAALTHVDGEFDPHTIVEGNVGDVTGRLSGLTADQLDAVEAAEKAKGDDKARKGVLGAIGEAREALPKEGETEPGAGDTA